MRRNLLAAAASLSVLLVACGEGGGGVVEIDDFGTVGGVAYIDRNGNGQIDQGDAPAPGAVAALVMQGSADTVARATTAADGSFIMRSVPVGRYDLVAGRGVLGDSVEVQNIDTVAVTVAANDTAVRTIRFGFPRLDVSALAGLPLGRRVVVEGIALNGWVMFGDSTVHVQDRTGAIRTIRAAPSAAQAGDSVRVLGTTGLDPSGSGRMVIADAAVIVLSAARGLPAIDSIGTSAAATANGGALANRQARIAGAFVLDTAVVAGDLILGVDDGSGRVEVILDRNVQFNPGDYAPGATFAGAGVLVPAPGNTWRLKPRDRTEASISFDVMSVEQARSLPAGRPVLVQGIALNGWTTFGDSTVNLEDTTGAIRAVRVRSAVGVGDSVRFSGTTGRRDGQPVLLDVNVTRLRAAARAPEPDSISAAVANNAGAGSLDARLVRVVGTIIGVLVENNGDTFFTVQDASGTVEVVFDVDISWPPGAYQPGSILDATGVLVPVQGGRWQIMPRAPSDAVANYPTVTIEAARQLPVGSAVYVVGKALNAWQSFSDSSVHLHGQTAAIRTIRIPQSVILAGDSVRIWGQISRSNGQVVLIGGSPSIVRVNAGVPNPDVLTIANARHASSGTKDADLVRVTGSITAIDSLALPAGVLLRVTITSAGDSMTMVVDRNTGITKAPFTVGRNGTFTGVLVPSASRENTWDLRPRSSDDLSFSGSVHAALREEDGPQRPRP